MKAIYDHSLSKTFLAPFLLYMVVCVCNWCGLSNMKGVIR